MRHRQVRLAEVVVTLSLATDLGTGMPVEHALRSCVVAVHLGDALGLDEHVLREVYYLALLRFAGCTADAHISAATFGDELAVKDWLATVDYMQPGRLLTALLRHHGADAPPLQRARLLVTALATMPSMMGTPAAHCEAGQHLAQRLGFGPSILHALGQVFERWDGRGLPRRLKGEAVAVPMRVVQLAQDVETFHRLGGVEAAMAMARQRAGGAHDPALVDLFCRQATRVLAPLAGESAWATALDAEPGARLLLSGDQWEEALMVMADFCDLKSRYTVGHSRGVAALAAGAARQVGLPDQVVEGLRHAGFVHDLGRVGVSVALWDKPGRLSEAEWERVRLHPYLTERVLCRSTAFAALAPLASLHHERLDGSGYYRGVPATMLSPAARLLAAADAYHAMTEPRPHRPPYAAPLAAEELRRAARAGTLDGAAVEAVLAVAGHRRCPARHARAGGLSEREVEVLRLLARGLSNKEMAARLDITKVTVGHHIQHIYDKIGVSTRAAATLFAVQHELLGDPAEAAGARY